MKGGFIHKTLILDELEEKFKQLGMQTSREVVVKARCTTGYIDLLVNLDGALLVIEAELTSKRISNDLVKAMNIGATWLWIVVPYVKVVEAVDRQLAALAVRVKEPSVCVLTLGQALQRVRGCFPLFSKPMVAGTQRKENHGD